VKPRQNPEAHLVADVADAFGSHPDIFMWRANTGAARSKNRKRFVRFNTDGTADFIGCLAPDGRFFAIECKSLNGVQSSDQIVFQGAMEQRGGLYILARCVEDVRRALRSVGINV
jgi:hypothetical protein